MSAQEPKRPLPGYTPTGTDYGAMTPEQFQNAERELRERLRGDNYDD